MNTKTTISITEARKKIFEIAEDVQKPGRYWTFTENGKPKAVIMSAEEYESWQETMEVMRDFPDIQKDIEKAHRDFEKGDYITLDELLVKQGIKRTEKHALHRNSTQKSTKRNK